MKSALFWDLQILLVVADVSGQPAGPFFKGQAAREHCVALENGTVEFNIMV
jgi:hypothetical protein